MFDKERRETFAPEGEQAPPASKRIIDGLLTLLLMCWRLSRRVAEGVIEACTVVLQIVKELAALTGFVCWYFLFLLWLDGTLRGLEKAEEKLVAAGPTAILKEVDNTPRSAQHATVDGEDVWLTGVQMKLDDRRDPAIDNLAVQASRTGKTKDWKIRRRIKEVDGVPNYDSSVPHSMRLKDYIESNVPSGRLKLEVESEMLTGRWNYSTPRKNGYTLLEGVDNISEKGTIALLPGDRYAELRTITFWAEDSLFGDESKAATLLLRGKWYVFDDKSIKVQVTECQVEEAEDVPLEYAQKLAKSLIGERWVRVDGSLYLNSMKLDVGTKDKPDLLSLSRY